MFTDIALLAGRALPCGCPPRRNALADHLALRSLPEIPRAVHAMVLDQQPRALPRIRSSGGGIRALVLHPNFAVVCLAGAALGAMERVAAREGRIEAAGAAAAGACRDRDACSSRRFGFRGYAICVAGLGAAVGACGGCGGLDSAARRDNDRLAVPRPVRFARRGAMVGLDGDDVPGTSARMVLVDFSLACRFQAHVPGIRLCRCRGPHFGLDPAPAQVEGMGNPPAAKLDGRTHTSLGSALDAMAAVARSRKKLPRD